MSPPSERAVQQATSVFELAPLGTTAEEFIRRMAGAFDAATAEGAREVLQAVAHLNVSPNLTGRDDWLFVGREDWMVAVNALLVSVRAEGAREMVVELAWLLNFVEEPEWFPNEGDAQWWRERMSRLRARAANLSEPPR